MSDSLEPEEIRNARVTLYAGWDHVTGEPLAPYTSSTIEAGDEPIRLAWVTDGEQFWPCDPLEPEAGIS